MIFSSGEQIYLFTFIFVTDDWCCLNYFALNKHKNIIKIKESWYIALFVVSGSIKKLFPIDCINIEFSESLVHCLF